MKSQPEWHHHTIMPWGPHKGKALKDVPNEWLYWLSRQPWISDYPQAHAYLKKKQVILEASVAADHQITSTQQTIEDIENNFQGFTRT